MDVFIVWFGCFTAFVCGGYGIVGIYPDLSTIFIPRFIGLWGVDAFLLTELSYVVFDLKCSKTLTYTLIGCYTLFSLFDLIINGAKDSNIYIRNEFYTTFERSLKNKINFHFIFIFFLGIVLVILSILWYRSKKTKIEKDFVTRIIFSNYVLVFATLPFAFGTKFSKSYPSFLYSLGYVFVYFMWYLAIKKRMSLDITVRNVSQEIFYSVDVPFMIFSMDGQISLYNPSAKERLNINDEKQMSIRDLFEISDVDVLRLLAKAKNGEEFQIKVRSKATDDECMLRTSVKLDYAGEPFCIICTALSLNQEIENEKGNI